MDARFTQMYVVILLSDEFIIFQSVTHQNGANAMSLKDIVLKTEPSALVYKLPTAHLIGQNGLIGVSAPTTQLEIAYR